MSGGAWGYLSDKLEERAEEAHGTAECLRLLAAIEHSLDWGKCSDTCYECAKLRTIAALEAFFEGGAMGATTAIAIARDWKQNRCQQCQQWEHERAAKERIKAVAV